MRLGGLDDIGQMLVSQELEQRVPGAGAIIGLEDKSRRRTRVRPVGDIQEYARQKARQMFGPGHWPELRELVMDESSWNPEADNKKSSAYGLFQFLDSTWDNYGGKTHDPYRQINKGLRYISDRYGNPTKADRFHDEHGWY